MFLQQMIKPFFLDLYSTGFFNIQSHLLVIIAGILSSIEATMLLLELLVLLLNFFCFLFSILFLFELSCFFLSLLFQIILSLFFLLSQHFFSKGLSIFTRSTLSFSLSFNLFSGLKSCKGSSGIIGFYTNMLRFHRMLRPVTPVCFRQSRRG